MILVVYDQLSRFLVRRTGSNFSAVILKRLFMSKISFSIMAVQMHVLIVISALAFSFFTANGSDPASSGTHQNLNLYFFFSFYTTVFFFFLVFW